MRRGYCIPMSDLCREGLSYIYIDFLPIFSYNGKKLFNREEYDGNEERRYGT